MTDWCIFSAQRRVVTPSSSLEAVSGCAYVGFDLVAE
jgi:hypothetical protein